MKIILLSLCLSLTSIALFGQPVLNSAQYNLAIGQVKKFDFIYSFDSSLTGPDVQWDFSDLDLNFFLSNQVFDPSTTAFGSNFPDSDFALGNDINDGRTFLSLENEGLFLDGSNNDNNVVNICTDSRQLFNFPLTYESTFSDSWSCGFTFAGIPTSDEGLITGKVDGYGTLILPFGTFSNVLRVRTFNDYVNSQVFSGGTLEVKIKETNFTFISALTGYQILSFSYLKPEGQLQETFGSVHLPQGTSAIIGADELIVDLKLFPNPTSDLLNIQVTKELKADISVLDIFGRTVFAEKEVRLSAMPNQVEIQALAPGIYFLNISSEGKRVVRRFVIE